MLLINVNYPLQVSFDVFKEHVLPSVNDDIFSGWAKATPDSLLLALYVQRRFGVSCLCCRNYDPNFICCFVVGNWFGLPVVGQAQGTHYDIVFFFQKYFEKKAFKKAWNTSNIIDAQNFSKMPSILQVIHILFFLIFYIINNIL